MRRRVCRLAVSGPRGQRELPLGSSWDWSCGRPPIDRGPIETTEPRLFARHSLFIPERSKDTRDAGLRRKSCRYQLKNLLVRTSRAPNPLRRYCTLKGGLYSSKIGIAVSRLMLYGHGIHKV